METQSTELKPWRSQFSHLIVERFQFLLWVTSRVETRTRGQAEHVTLPFLCLCLAGGSKMGKGEKPPLNHVLGLAEKSWIGGQTLSLTGNSTRLGALWHQRPCLPHLMRCSLSAGLCLIICFLFSPTSSSVTNKHLKM